MKNYNSNNKIFINDDIFYFNESDGLNLYQISLLWGFQIPKFCYHVKLNIVGNCRVCLVEIFNLIKPVISCSVLAEKNMKFFTNSHLVKSSQEAIFEYLLINHPLDCPVCDQGGECDLQDQVMIFGSDRGRFYESFKRSVEDKNYGPLIKVILNRCIHCARCTRFLWEIVGMNFSSLIFINRGIDMQIGSYINTFISNELSGNIIDLCPVGALTSKPYSFISRFWEIYSFRYIDIMDCIHSSISINFRGLHIIRIIPIINENLNENWITDKIRFFYDGLVVQRLVRPFFLYKLRKIYISWLCSLFFLKFYFFNVLLFFFKKKKKYIFLNLFFGELLTCQELFLIKNFCLYFNINIYKYIYIFKNLYNDFRIFYLFNKKLKSFIYEEKYNNEENIKFFFTLEDILNMFVLIFLNPRFETPIFNIKLKQVLYNSIIVIFGFISNLNYYFIHLGTNFFFFFKLLENISLLYIYIKKKINYYWIFNSNFFFNNNIDYYYIKFILLKNKNFFINTVSVNCCDISVLELNINNNFFNNFNLYFNINNIYTLYYNFVIDNIKNYFFFNKFSLRIYQGSHGDYFIKYCNLIFPVKIIFEQPGIFINMEGLVQNFQTCLFKYNLKSIKNNIDIIYILLEIFKINYKFKKSNVYLKVLEKLGIFKLYDNFLIYLDIFIFNNDMFYFFIFKIKFFFINFYSFINNYYLTNYLVRNSKVLTLASKYFTVINDFKYIYNSNFL